MRKLFFAVISFLTLTSNINSQEKVSVRGVETILNGNIPQEGITAPNFTATKADMTDIQLSDYKGKNVILNIFPSLDTPTCAMSVRQFNAKASSLDNTVVICVSMDLPFAQSRFCSVEGLNNVIPLSVFRSPDFKKNYGVICTNGPLKGLTARAVIVINSEGKIIHTELVKNVSEEPNYQKALESLSK